MIKIMIIIVNKICAKEKSNIIYYYTKYIIGQQVALHLNLIDLHFIHIIIQSRLVFVLHYLIYYILLLASLISLHD